MKHLSRLALVGFIPLSLFSLTSCNKTYYTSAKQIAPFLHEITYNDYEEDTEYETTHTIDNSLSVGACTSIRNKNLYGRNYDYYYSNSCSFLVKVKGNEHHFKSIGIANHLGIHEEDVINLEKSPRNQHKLSVIPNFMLDGINENGVVCNMNVVDIEDGGGTILSTNPGKPKLYLFFALRYILDHATSAANAISLLQERDIYSLPHHENTVHFMIADMKETYIVEFVTPKGSEITELRASPKSGDAQIMTNFYNNLSKEEVEATYPPETPVPEDEQIYNNNGHGIERYEFIKDYCYDDCESTYGMWAALYDTRYGMMYYNPLTPDWPSEDFSQEEIYKAEQEAGEEGIPYYEDYHDIYALTRFVLENKRRDIGRISDVWITMHSSIYDIENKTLKLNAQEDYAHTYNYDLNF